MVREITGYKWANENGANSAKANARQYYGYPVSPENTTVEAIKPLHNTGSEGDFWYYEGYLEPLGNIKTFTINEQTNFDV